MFGHELNLAASNVHNILPNTTGAVSPLASGVEIHPIDDRVDAAVEDGGEENDVLNQAWDYL